MSGDGFFILFPHARWKLDVEVFDRELAGDQAREEEVAGLGEMIVLALKLMFHIENWIHHPRELRNQMSAVEHAF